MSTGQTCVSKDPAETRKAWRRASLFYSIKSIYCNREIIKLPTRVETVMICFSLVWFLFFSLFWDLHVSLCRLTGGGSRADCHLWGPGGESPEPATTDQWPPLTTGRAEAPRRWWRGEKQHPTGRDAETPTCTAVMGLVFIVVTTFVGGLSMNQFRSAAHCLPQTGQWNPHITWQLGPS